MPLKVDEPIAVEDSHLIDTVMQSPGGVVCVATRTVLLQKIDGSAMLRNLRTEFIKETIKTDGKSIQVATL